MRYGNRRQIYLCKDFHQYHKHETISGRTDLSQKNAFLHGVPRSAPGKSLMIISNLACDKTQVTLLTNSN